MPKKKSAYEYIRRIRREWVMDPKTRVQENVKKNKKKRRQDEKKQVNRNGEDE